MLFRHAVLLIVVSFLIKLPAQAQKLSVTGTQIKSEKGRIELTCEAITVEHNVSITEVSGLNAGFWISGKYGRIENFKNVTEAVGYALGPGTYWVYPHLRTNQQEAAVTVKFKRDESG